MMRKVGVKKNTEEVSGISSVVWELRALFPEIRACHHGGEGLRGKGQPYDNELNFKRRFEIHKRLFGC